MEVEAALASSRPSEKSVFLSGAILDGARSVIVCLDGRRSRMRSGGKGCSRDEGAVSWLPSSGKTFSTPVREPHCVGLAELD